MRLLDVPAKKRKVFIRDGKTSLMCLMLSIGVSAPLPSPLGQEIIHRSGHLVDAHRPLPATNSRREATIKAFAQWDPRLTQLKPPETIKFNDTVGCL